MCKSFLAKVVPLTIQLLEEGACEAKHDMIFALVRAHSLLHGRVGIDSSLRENLFAELLSCLIFPIREDQLKLLLR